jgi:hypothetical protein
MHVYHAIREVMMVPQIYQFFLFDGLAGVGISDKIQIVKTPGGSHFVAFSQAFTQFEYCMNILIHSETLRY